MNKKITSQLQQLDNSMEQLFQEMANMSEDILNKKPDTNSWSAFQVMHHLMMAENASMAYVKKKLSFNPSLKKAGFVEKNIRPFLVWASLTSPFKFKAPAAISGENLPQVSNLEDIEQAWRKNRKEMKNYLISLPDDIWDKAIYKNFGGRLTLSGMLQFFQDHFNHHKKQMFRTIQQVK